MATKLSDCGVRNESGVNTRHRRIKPLVWHEIIADVIAHSIFQRRDRCGVPGGPQPGQVRLGEILIFVTDGFRHFDEFNLRLAFQSGKNGARQVQPGPRLAAADVEQAAGPFAGSQMQGHRHGVFHVKKIALLFTVAVIGAVTLEQPDDTLGPHLGCGLVDERPHFAFVALVGSEHIEIFQADDLLQKPRAPGVQIKELL